jgi:hypothetical protein
MPHARHLTKLDQIASHMKEPVRLPLKKAQGTHHGVACKQQGPQNITPHSMQFHATGGKLDALLFAE